MYDIFVKTHFAGAHHLRDYPGDCEKPHGHNWKVKVTVRATELDHLGMGMDFTVLKKHVKEAIDTIDHCDLNEHAAFQTRNPSSEHIAQYLFELLVDKVKHERHALYSIEVRETDKQGLVYYG
ncbi:MAG: 6-carboxytetrahydropterin synthase QueD [Desulfopila sp.]